MTSKTKAKAKDKEQSKRFIEKAREIEADESRDVFERAFKKIVPPQKSGSDKLSKRTKKRSNMVD